MFDPHYWLVGSTTPHERIQLEFIYVREAEIGTAVSLLGAHSTDEEGRIMLLPGVGSLLGLAVVALVAFVGVLLGGIVAIL
ncbi:hypothetical protein [Nocardia pseudobrasiliensis]|nr:hypothetical protein [Nocardia pseudobrasiliensis]